MLHFLTLKKPRRVRGYLTRFKRGVHPGTSDFNNHPMNKISPYDMCHVNVLTLVYEDISNRNGKSTYNIQY